MDKTLGNDEGANQVFKLVVSALNKILKMGQEQGVNCKYQAMELCMKAWTIWFDYQKEKSPSLMLDLQDCGKKLMELVG